MCVYVCVDVWVHKITVVILQQTAYIKSSAVTLAVTCHTHTPYELMGISRVLLESDPSQHRCTVSFVCVCVCVCVSVSVCVCVCVCVCV